MRGRIGRNHWSGIFTMRASRYLTDQKAFYEETRIHREALPVTPCARGYPDSTPKRSTRISNSCRTITFALSKSMMLPHICGCSESFSTNLYHQSQTFNGSRDQVGSVSEQGHSIGRFALGIGSELLAKIAGSFSTIPINILSADIYSRGDHLVLDVFRVCDGRSKAVTDPQAMAEVEETLRQSLENEHFDFQPLIAKARGKNRDPNPQEIDIATKITIDNKAHPTYTLVQVQTPDRLGLLYDVLSCLGRAGVYIALSRISTEKGAAIDTFYVADAATRSKIIDAQRIATLQEAFAAGGPCRVLEFLPTVPDCVIPFS